MKIRTSQFIPARFSYAEPQSRQDGWGRLGRLSPAGAELVTRFRLGRGESLWLSFDLFGEAFDSLPARVARAGLDSDGYWAADLRFAEGPARLRLGRSLRDILSGLPEA